MKIQILSDQHVEFKKNSKYFKDRCHARADVLIIAGDLCPHVSPKRFHLINNFILQNWNQTIVIPGNHEFYGSHKNDDWFGENERLFSNSYGNQCHYVNNKVVEIDGFYFVCSTLWSHIGYEKASQIQYSMNDYHQIHGLTVDRVNEIHKKNRRWLQDAVNNIPDGKKCIIVTHHTPSFNLINPRWRGNELNEAFSADMDTFIMMFGDKISHWIHGHSHDYIDTVINGIRFIRNPMGYPQERDCDMDLVIDV
jgi:predicted phosphodiesterase